MKYPKIKENTKVLIINDLFVYDTDSEQYNLLNNLNNQIKSIYIETLYIFKRVKTGSSHYYINNLPPCLNNIFIKNILLINFSYFTDDDFEILWYNSQKVIYKLDKIIETVNDYIKLPYNCKIESIKTLNNIKVNKNISNKKDIQYYEYILKQHKNLVFVGQLKNINDKYEIVKTKGFNIIHLK